MAPARDAGCALAPPLPSTWRCSDRRSRPWKLLLTHRHPMHRTRQHCSRDTVQHQQQCQHQSMHHCQRQHTRQQEQQEQRAQYHHRACAVDVGDPQVPPRAAPLWQPVHSQRSPPQKPHRARARAAWSRRRQRWRGLCYSQPQPQPHHRLLCHRPCHAVADVADPLPAAAPFSAQQCCVSTKPSSAPCLKDTYINIQINCLTRCHIGHRCSRRTTARIPAFRVGDEVLTTVGGADVLYACAAECTAHV